MNGRYQDIRRDVLKDQVLRERLPDFVKMFDDLWKIRRYITDSLSKGESVKDRVAASFAELVAYLDGEQRPVPDTDPVTEPPLAPDLDSQVHVLENISPPEEAGAVEIAEREATPASRIEAARAAKQPSSNRRKLAKHERARLILDMAPAALEGVRALLVEHERRLHNHPPEAVEKDGLEALRALHRELGLLIACIERGEKPDRHIAFVRKLSTKVFTFAAGTTQLCVGGLQPILASIPVAWGTLALLEAVCTPATYAALGAPSAVAILGGYFAYQMKPGSSSRGR